MFTLANLWTSLHFLFLFWLMVGLGALVPTSIMAERSKDVHAIANYTRLMEIAEKVFLIPGVILVPVAGALLGFEVGWHFIDHRWLLVSWILYAIVILITFVYLSPNAFRLARLAKAAEEKGQLTPQLERALAKKGPMVLGNLLLLIFLTIGFLMVFKPF